MLDFQEGYDNDNYDQPFQEGYNDTAAATAAAAAATAAAFDTYNTKSPKKAARSAMKAGKFARKARSMAERVGLYFKGSKLRRRVNMEKIRKATLEANMAAKLAANAAERKRIQNENNVARDEAVRRSRQEADEQREARRLANEAAQAAENVAEIAIIEAFKREANNMIRQYKEGTLSKRKLLLKIHPNKIASIRTNDPYFNKLNNYVKRM